MVNTFEDMLDFIESRSILLKNSLEAGDGKSKRLLDEVKRQNITLYRKARREEANNVVEKTREIAAEIKKIADNIDNPKKTLGFVGIILETAKYLKENLAGFEDMDLVVVHPLPSKPMRTEINNEIALRIKKGLHVYLLKETFGFPIKAHKNIISVPNFINPETFNHIPHEGKTYLGKRAHYAPQFLQLKKLLVENGVKRVGLCGQARKACVQNVLDLILGNVPVDDSKEFKGYKAAAEFLGFSDEKSFLAIFQQKITCNVIEELCK
jgi:hypothetical protein